MTAKEKQIEFIKVYLKPKLKEEGFSTSGQTWWKNKGDFFIVINLQNSQWNSKDRVSFCFNIGIALTERLKDPTKNKATYNDIVTNLREEAYLSEDRQKHKYRQDGWLGYLLTDKTDLADFIKELKFDFENEILPKLSRLSNLDDCLNYYKNFEVWGEILRKLVND